MSTAQELDFRVQNSLLSKVKLTSQVYTASKASPEALGDYVAALESLADYVSARWRGYRLIPEIPMVSHQAHAKTPAHSERPARVLPFARASSGGSSPFTAA